MVAQGGEHALSSGEKMIVKRNWSLTKRRGEKRFDLGGKPGTKKKATFEGGEKEQRKR